VFDDFAGNEAKMLKEFHKRDLGLLTGKSIVYNSLCILLIQEF